LRFIVNGVMRQMNLDDACPIVDTVTDLALYDKRGVCTTSLTGQPTR
jgi:hypothetical protein